MSLNVFGRVDKDDANSNSLENAIRGSWFTATETANIVSITTYLIVTSASHTAKCAIYEYVADGNAGNLLGQTNENTVTVSSAWNTFTFAAPVAVTANTKYFLVIWANATTGDIAVPYATVTAKGVSYALTYTTNYPNPLAGESVANTHYSIYANYENGPLHTRISQEL